MDENKTELFNFLAHEVVDNLSIEKEVFSTCGRHVLCSRVHHDVSALAPCSHEEADTRMFLHAKDAAEKGYRRIMLRTVDTDVVVLAVSTVVSMENTQLWIAFGTGKHLRYIPTHEIATSLGAEKAQARLMFHVFTGCDTVSSFVGKGKKTAFDTWRSFNAATEVFARLVTRPTSLDNVCMSVLESYVVLMYDWGSDETTVECGLSQEAHVHVKSQIYRRHSTNQSCTAAACKTSNIPGWPRMGSGPGPRSRTSFSRVLGMEQESDTRMGTDVDVTPRSGRVLLRVVKMRL